MTEALLSAQKTWCVILKSSKLQCKVKTEPKRPLFSLILNPSDSFVSVLFWGDGERWATFVHFSGYKSQLWPRTSGTSLINGFVSRSPLLMLYHDIDRMGEGFMICSALCKERNGHFSLRAGDLLCPSPAPACQGLHTQFINCHFCGLQLITEGMPRFFCANQSPTFSIPCRVSLLWLKSVLSEQTLVVFERYKLGLCTLMMVAGQVPCSWHTER